MNQPKNWIRILGVVLCVGVGLIMLIAGIGKAFGTAPPQVVEQMVKLGLRDHMVMIGMGAILSSILFMLPWTTGLGTLLVSAYWGGAICVHMAHGEGYDLQALFLVLAWLGAYLRGSVPLFWIQRKEDPLSPL